MDDHESSTEYNNIVFCDTLPKVPAGDFKSISKSAENLFRCGHIEVATATDTVYIKSKFLR